MESFSCQVQTTYEILPVSSSTLNASVASEQKSVWATDKRESLVCVPQETHQDLFH